MNIRLQRGFLGYISIIFLCIYGFGCGESAAKGKPNVLACSGWSDNLLGGYTPTAVPPGSPANVEIHIDYSHERYKHPLGYGVEHLGLREWIPYATKQRSLTTVLHLVGHGDANSNVYDATIGGGDSFTHFSDIDSLFSPPPIASSLDITAIPITTNCYTFIFVQACCSGQDPGATNMRNSFRGPGPFTPTYLGWDNYTERVIDTRFSHAFLLECYPGRTINAALSTAWTWARAPGRAATLAWDPKPKLIGDGNFTIDCSPAGLAAIAAGTVKGNP